jgi:hypothetical protein
MARPGMRELIGRAMIDKDFLTDLVRDPATVLGGYDLEAAERAGAATGAASRDDEAVGDLGPPASKAR